MSNQPDLRHTSETRTRTLAPSHTTSSAGALCESKTHGNISRYGGSFGARQGRYPAHSLSPGLGLGMSRYARSTDGQRQQDALSLERCEISSFNIESKHRRCDAQWKQEVKRSAWEKILSAIRNRVNGNIEWEPGGWGHANSCWSKSKPLSWAGPPLQVRLWSSARQMICRVDNPLRSFYGALTDPSLADLRNTLAKSQRVWLRTFHGLVTWVRSPKSVEGP